ncbi:MAG TPA: hypothetical protein VLT60_01055 [Usitatibacter sp.]|nr:hypothetical protein [Usitatibacter sp.]
MRAASAGHALFAATMIALGILGLAEGDFAPIWQPVPKDFPAREIAVHLCALVPLATGAGLLFHRTAPLSARVLLGWLAIWLLSARLPALAREPASIDRWFGVAEMSVYAAGAAMLCGKLPGRHGRRIASALFALALVLFGVAHFIYIRETASLVPRWLPAHLALAYATGFTYIAAGAAILAGRKAGLAAALSALQMGLFTLLVWVPIVMAGPGAFAWSEFVISCTLTASAWVVADSYRSALQPQDDDAGGDEGDAAPFA